MIYIACPTLCDSMDCSLPGSFVHEILQVRILERVAILRCVCVPLCVCVCLFCCTLICCLPISTNTLPFIFTTLLTPRTPTQSRSVNTCWMNKWLQYQKCQNRSVNTEQDRIICLERKGQSVQPSWMRPCDTVWQKFEKDCPIRK